jgi:pimeloyl-ACP methyl ester carboxylesterase
VGFSWGGRIGCSFAACFPERAAGLALIDRGYLEGRTSRASTQARISSRASPALVGAPRAIPS